MDVYASEKEQVEALRKWFKENGSSIISGLLIGLAVVFGGKAWFGYQDKLAAQASNHYTQMIHALKEDKPEGVLQTGGKIINEYSGSPYAALAALAMARVAIDDGDYATASNHLRWAMEHGKPEAVKEIARQRLIRLAIVDGDLDTAERMLQGAGKAKAYQPGYDELRGDLWVARGENAKAAQAYRAAVAGLRPDAPALLLLRLKLDDTGFNIGNGDAQ